MSLLELAVGLITEPVVFVALVLYVVVLLLEELA
jgi:hypothetical protein